MAPTTAPTAPANGTAPTRSGDIPPLTGGDWLLILITICFVVMVAVMAAGYVVGWRMRPLREPHTFEEHNRL